MAEVATRLNMSRKELFGWLLAQRIFYRDPRGENLPQAPYQRAGLFRVVCTQYSIPGVGRRYRAHAEATVAGLAWLLKKREAPHGN
jgi:phage antirepressor YoqD-like protein